MSGFPGVTKKRLVRKYRVTPPAVGRMGDPDVRYYTIVRLAALETHML